MISEGYGAKERSVAITSYVGTLNALCEK